MRRALAGAALALVPLAVAASCRAKATEVVVIVDSDLALPGEIDDVVVEVHGRGDFTRTFDAGAPPLPGTVEIEASDPTEPVTVIVRALSSGRVVLERRVDTGFVNEESRAIEMMLCRACEGVTCASDATCTESGCAATAVRASDLPAWTGSAPPRPRCGQSADGGADAGPDGSVSCVVQAQIAPDGGTYTLDTCAGSTAVNPCDGTGRHVQGAVARMPQAAGSFKVTASTGAYTAVFEVDDGCVKSNGAGCASPTSTAFVRGGQNVFVSVPNEPCRSITVTVTPP